MECESWSLRVQSPHPLLHSCLAPQISTRLLKPLSLTFSAISRYSVPNLYLLSTSPLNSHHSHHSSSQHIFSRLSLCHHLQSQDSKQDPRPGGGVSFDQSTTISLTSLSLTSLSHISLAHMSLPDIALSHPPDICSISLIRTPLSHLILTSLSHTSLSHISLSHLPDIFSDLSLSHISPTHISLSHLSHISLSRISQSLISLPHIPLTHLSHTSSQHLL